MSVKDKEGKVSCLLCDKKFVRPVDADMHMIIDHRVVYVPFDLLELQNLVNFIYSKDERFLNPRMISLLRKILRENMNKKGAQIDMSDM